MIAAGINYVTDLAIQGYKPMVINMSLGGSELADVEREAIDRAIANGVIVVASAGNEGEYGMGFPGAYAPVISAGSAGWTGEWKYPETGVRYRLFWLQSEYYPYIDIAEPTTEDVVYLLNGRGSRARGASPLSAGSRQSTSLWYRSGRRSR